MRWYKCVNVGAWEGLGAACTPHEVARMSFTIIEAAGIVLDEPLVHTLVHLLVAVLVEELVRFLVEEV